MTRVGRYILGEELGRGGMGAVYTAWDPNLERHVAVKVIAPELARDPAFVTRFLREVRIAATLEHPNVVPVYEAGESDGTLFMVMRLIPGDTLQDVIDTEGALGAPRVVRLARQLGSALDAAHSRGLVHRDVKPANILLSASGDDEHLCLADFGLARHAASTSGVTGTGQWIGTVDFVAPEILDQSGTASARSDIYSMSCVMFQALTGRVPYTGPVPRKLAGHASEPLPSVGSAVVNAPAIDAVLARGAAKDPLARPASAGEFARLLADAVAESAAPPRAEAVAPTVMDTVLQPGASRQATPQQGHRRSGRSPWIPAGIVAALALIAAGVGVATLATGDAKPGVSVSTQTVGQTTTIVRGTTETVTTGDGPGTTPASTGSETTLTPTFTAGRYVQLGSFRTGARASAEASTLQARGVDATVLASDDAQELLPWFQVVVAGPVTSTAEAQATIRAARAAGVPDAFRRPLTPEVSAADPTLLAGTHRGRMRQTSAGDTVADKRVPVTMTFAEDGQTGTVVYDDPACSGSLTLDTADGAALTYRETIDSGSCTQGGAWRIKRASSGLAATWRRAGRLYFVSGRLS